ncbi:MAG: phospholipase D-like domain-containing protein, partial [Candidatus Nitrosocaldus sp.]
DAYNNGVFASDGLLLKIGFTPPIANAGSDQTVDEGTLVTLDGSSSYDPDGDALTYQWEQIQGPSVTLSDPSSPTPSFTAPFVDVITTLKFRLTVSDGVQSSQATVTVYVRNTSAYDYYPWFTLKGSDFFNVADEPSLRLQQFSVSAWFRTSSAFTSPAIIVNKGGFDTSASKLNYGLWITTNGNLSGGFEDANGIDYFIRSPNTYNDGQWHYAVVTYDGSTLNLYVDGSLVSSLNTNGAIPATDTMPLTIGKNSLDSSRYFIGDIDEVRIYNRALTAQEVNDAYNNGVFASDGLIKYLHMDHKLLLSGISNMRDEFFYDLLDSIQNAKRKVHAAMYWLEYNASKGSNYRPNMLLNALVDAKNRGVDIRLMTFSGSFSLFPDLQPFLENNGIPYKLVGTHAKIINIDDEVVYVGTGNWNSNGLRNNHEMHIKTSNPNIMNRAITYINKLWNNEGRTAYSDDQYDNILVTDGYFETVLNHLQRAKQSISILMFQIGPYNSDPTYKPGQLLRALVDAKNRGVDVKVIVDGDYDGNGDGTPSNQSAANYLKNNGIQVKYDERDPPRTHIKMVIIDHETMFVGAHNWLEHQLASTNETSIKLKSPFILNDAVNYFNWKWQRGRDISQ